MTKIFITGDRAVTPAVAFVFFAPVLNKVLRENPDVEFVTGDAPLGVERLVRYLIPEARLTVLTREVVDGKVDLDTTAAEAAKLCAKAIVIVPNPAESRIATVTNNHFKHVELPLQDLKKTNSLISDEEKAAFEELTKNISFDEPKE